MTTVGRMVAECCSHHCCHRACCGPNMLTAGLMRSPLMEGFTVQPSRSSSMNAGGAAVVIFVMKQRGRREERMRKARNISRGGDART